MKRYSAETPSDLGLAPDAGANSADSNYEDPKSEDLGGEFSDPGSTGGGGGGGGASLFDSPGGAVGAPGGAGPMDTATLTESVSDTLDMFEGLNLSPEQTKFVDANKEEYTLFQDDLYSELHKMVNIDHEDPTSPDFNEKAVQNLKNIGWSDDALFKLSLNSPQENLSSFVENISKKVKNERKSGFSLTKDRLFRILDNIKQGGRNMDKNKFSVSPDGKLAKVSVPAVASTEITASKLSEAKKKLSVAIMTTRRATKKVRSNMTMANGVLFKKAKILKAMENFDEVDPMAAGAEGGEVPNEMPSDLPADLGADLGEVDAEMSDTSDDLAGSLTKLQDSITELDETAKEVKELIEVLTPGTELSKEEEDESHELLEEGEEASGEGEEAIDEADDLIEEVKASNQVASMLIRKANGSKDKSKKEIQIGGHDEGKAPKKPTELAKSSKVQSFFQNILGIKKAEESSMKDDSKKEEAAEKKEEKEEKSAAVLPERITKASQILTAISAGTISDPKDLWTIPTTVVASWTNLAGEVSALMASGRDEMADALIERASQANQIAPKIKEASAFNIYKPIEETAKQKGELADLAPEIERGSKSQHGAFIKDTENFNTAHGSEFGTLAPAMGKFPKAASTNTLPEKLRYRKAMEIAFEEQHKAILENPLAVEMANKFEQLGLSEDQAIEASFDVLANAFENTIKIALAKGFEYANLDETGLLKKAKDVATYKVALFDSGVEAGEVVQASAGTQVRTASAQKPMIRNMSETSSAEPEALFQKILI